MPRRRPKARARDASIERLRTRRGAILTNPDFLTSRSRRPRQPNSATRATMASAVVARSVARSVAPAAAGQRARRGSRPAAAATTRATRAKAVAAGRSSGDTGDDDAVTTARVPVLGAAEVHARLAERVHPKARDTYAAFYSSWCAAPDDENPRTDPSPTLATQHPRPSIRSATAAIALLTRLKIPTSNPPDTHAQGRMHNHRSRRHGRPVRRPHGPPRARRLRHRARLRRPVPPPRQAFSPVRAIDAIRQAQAPAGQSLASMRATILATIAASGLRDAQVRYYAGAGPGGSR